MCKTSVWTCKLCCGFEEPCLSIGYLYFDFKGLPQSKTEFVFDYDKSQLSFFKYFMSNPVCMCVLACVCVIECVCECVCIVCICMCKPFWHCYNCCVTDRLTLKYSVKLSMNLWIALKKACSWELVLEKEIIICFHCKSSHYSWAPATVL